MLSLSSGSSPGSLASSRGSLVTSSQDSSTSVSFTDLYYEQFGQMDFDYQNKMDLLLLERTAGFRPSGCITTIRENEVVKTQETDATSHLQALRPLSGTSKSLTSLSPRSSLSSPSPPCSPLVTDPFFTGDAFLSHMDFEDMEINSGLSELTLTVRNGRKCRLQESKTRGKHLDQGSVTVQIILKKPFFKGSFNSISNMFMIELKHKEVLQHQTLTHLYRSELLLTAS